MPHVLCSRGPSFVDGAVMGRRWIFPASALGLASSLLFAGGCGGTGSSKDGQPPGGGETGSGGLPGAGGVTQPAWSGGTAGGPASGGAPAVATGGAAGSPTSGGTSSAAGGSTAGNTASGGTPSVAGGSPGAGGTPEDGGADVDADADAATQECGAFPAVTDLTKSGPLTTSNATEGNNCQIYRPATLGGGGARHPIILWANGTGGPTFVYTAAFDYWASYGFIVAAGNSSNGQGSGVEMLSCLDYLTTENGRAGGPYEGKVCLARVGASGHSQGGGGALMAGRDPRLTATAPLMPYIAQGFGGFDTASITKQQGPMLLLSGTADAIAPPGTNQQPVFDATNVPVFWANLVGGDHVAVSLNGLDTYRNVMLGWYRLALMGDETFRKTFYGPSCTLCTDSAWQVQRKGID